MGKKAVDVVLLPDEAMTEEAIQANAELVKKFGKKISLNKKNSFDLVRRCSPQVGSISSPRVAQDGCLPHISLAMGCVDEEDIALVERILRSITKECSLSELTVLGVQISKNAAGEKVSAFEVEKTEELQLLHEMVSEKLAPYLSCDVTSDMVCAEGEVEESTLLWIKNYRGKSSFDKFFPHITIGYGELSNFLSFPIKFAASKLALCYLGEHCTCRGILVSIEL
jgi:2'-5' RNA ligase